MWHSHGDDGGSGDDGDNDAQDEEAEEDDGGLAAIRDGTPADRCVCVCVCLFVLGLPGGEEGIESREKE